MKKLILIPIILFTFSCKKDRVCECDISEIKVYNDGTKTEITRKTNTLYKGMSKGDVKSDPDCVSYHKEYSAGFEYNNSTGRDYKLEIIKSCEIK